MTNFPQTDVNGRIIALDAKGNVSIDCITEDPILVQGVVDFSHITRMYVGQELAAENARRTQRGLTPINRPFTQITIKNAQVIVNNPQQKTVNDYYAENKLLFASKKHPEKGFCCTGTNKGNTLPAVFQRDSADTNKVMQITPDGEPAQELKVTLVLRPFKPKKVGMHTGITLDTVIIDEPFRKATFGGAASLEGLGLSVTPATAEAVQAYNKAGYAQGMPNNTQQVPQMQTANAQYGQAQNQQYYNPMNNQQGQAINQFAQPAPFAQQPMNQYTANMQYAQSQMQTEPAPYGQPQQYAPQQQAIPQNMNQYVQPAQPAVQPPVPESNVQQQQTQATAVAPQNPAQPEVDPYGGITLED